MELSESICGAASEPHPPHRAPTPDRSARIIGTAVRAHEDKRIAALHARLTTAMRVAATGGPEGNAEIEDMAAPDRRADAPLIHLRAGLGRASRTELEACRQRVAVEAPYELRRHPDATRHAWLAAYAIYAGAPDTLVDLLIETVHHIGARAEHRVEQDLLDDLKRVRGNRLAVPNCRCCRRTPGW
jgi:hypothetical protein